MGYNRRQNQNEKEALALDRAIKAFYTGEMSTITFVKEYWSDSWEALITYVSQSGFNMRNGKLPQALLDKKEEFEATLVKLPKSMPKQETTKEPSWYVPWKKSENLNNNARKFYNGKMNIQDFLQGYAGTWDEMIDTVVAVGKLKSREEIPEEFLAKKAEFEENIIKYFENEYCKMTQILVNGKYVHPTIEDVHKAIVFLRQSGMGLGKSTVGQAVTKYLRGEIEVQQVLEKESQVEVHQEDTLDLRPMREQRNKCQMLETRLKQMKGNLENKRTRLQEVQKLLGQHDMEIAKIQEIAAEILEIAQQIEEEQKNIDGLDVERIAEEQQLKNMKAAAIAEIEKI